LGAWTRLLCGALRAMNHAGVPKHYAGTR
jgi:hypothetical protein